jgi:hypothetical protein
VTDPPLFANVIYLEVILSSLVESFSFSPSDKEIEWNLATIAWPGVKGSSVAQLPLRVSKLV